MSTAPMVTERIYDLAVGAACLTPIVMLAFIGLAALIRRARR